MTEGDFEKIDQHSMASWKMNSENYKSESFLRTSAFPHERMAVKWWGIITDTTAECHTAWATEIKFEVGTISQFTLIA